MLYISTCLFSVSFGNKNFSEAWEHEKIAFQFYLPAPSNGLNPFNFVQYID